MELGRWKMMQPRTSRLLPSPVLVCSTCEPRHVDPARCHFIDSDGFRCPTPARHGSRLRLCRKHTCLECEQPIEEKTVRLCAEHNRMKRLRSLVSAERFEFIMDWERHNADEEKRHGRGPMFSLCKSCKTFMGICEGYCEHCEPPQQQAVSNKSKSMAARLFH